jgi:hypothetical protein
MIVTDLRLLAVALLAALLASGCLDRGSRLAAGDRCTDGLTCGEGLACEYGRCRPLCTLDRDCAPDGVCVAVEGGGRVCTLPDEGGCTDAACPDGLECSVDGLCREPCEG